MATEDWRHWLGHGVEDLRGAQLLRELRPISPIDAVHVGLEGRELTLFSSNDYLGLSDHPDVREHMSQEAFSSGLGPRGSPLICGYTTSHEALEGELAALKGCERAVLCPTGFAANLMVIAALSGPDVEIFSDRLNHASIIDGCRLGRRRGAVVTVYEHASADDLREKLAASDAARKIVVTDAVFSMDGDLAPLPELVEVCERGDTLLVVDEAHATLVFGRHGGGLVEHFGLEEGVDVQVGTLSKAVGAMGGFVAASKTMCEWLLNRGRAYVFSTAQPVPVVEACRAAIRVSQRRPETRARLWSRVEQLGQGLGRRLRSPIVPIVLGEEAEALEASRALFEAGFHVTAIRPPTVPEGTSRLRIAVSAAHREEDIEGLLRALRAL